MSYQKQEWRNNDPATPLSAARMNHIEDGIQAASKGPAGMPVYTGYMQARAENAKEPCNTPTQDGSGETVHPSVVYVEKGWRGHRYWMLVTGYGNSDSSLENPHLLASHDGQDWFDPEGLQNPIKATPPGGWNSDTDLVLVDDVMYCFYRSTLGTATAPTRDTIYLQTTSDAKSFTEEQVVIESPVGEREFVSPTVVHDEATDTWRMWVVNSVPDPREVILFESSSPSGPWAEIGVTEGLTAPLDSGQDLWHIEVRDNGGEYTAMYSDSPAGVSSYGSLWRATSADGLSWEADPMAVLMGLSGSWDQGIYRSSAVPAVVDGKLGYYLWYSAYSGEAWRTGMTTVSLAPRDEYDLSATLASNRVQGWLAGDLVDREDAEDGPGVATSGHQWEPSVGTMGVKGRTLSPYTDTNSNALIDLGTPDMDVSVQFSNGEEGAPWLVARAGADGDGHLSFVRFGTTSNLQYYTLEWFNSGVQPVTVIASMGPTPQAGDRMRLVCKGDRIRTYVNGYLRMDYTVDMPEVKENTLAGVQTASSSQGLYNFAARVS